MITVYAAGPYTGKTPEEIEANVKRALDVGDALEDAGLCAFIPHLSHWRHAHKPRDYEHWMAVDFEWVKRCDALLRMEGASSGADREVVFANENGIPVFNSVEEVLRWVLQ